MAQSPSRKDTFGAPKPGRNVTDLAAIDRHQGSYLRSLDPGMLGGRFGIVQPFARGPIGDVGGDDGAGDAGSEREWQWEDRHTVTATGTQRPTLTYEPVEESLVVRWHPAGLGAAGDLTNEHFYVDGRTVTIPDPGILAVGDQFSFQYEFEPDLSDAGEKLDSLTLRDTLILSTTTQQTPGLPADTEDGDFVVIAATWADSGTGTVTCTDGRFTAVGPGTNKTGMWVGPADGLAAPAFTNTAFRAVFVLASFVQNDVVVEAFESATASGTTASLAAPVLAGSAAVAGVMDGEDVVIGGGGLPSPWVLAVNSGNGLVHAAIYYWLDDSLPNTPASSASFNGGGGARTVTVCTLELL